MICFLKRFTHVHETIPPSLSIQPAAEPAGKRKTASCLLPFRGARPREALPYNGGPGGEGCRSPPTAAQRRNRATERIPAREGPANRRTNGDCSGRRLRYFRGEAANSLLWTEGLRKAASWVRGAAVLRPERLHRRPLRCHLAVKPPPRNAARNRGATSCLCQHSCVRPGTLHQVYETAAASACIRVAAAANFLKKMGTQGSRTGHPRTRQITPAYRGAHAASFGILLAGQIHETTRF